MVSSNKQMAIPGKAVADRSERTFRRRVRRSLLAAGVVVAAAMAGGLHTFNTAGGSIGGSNNDLAMSNGLVADIGATVMNSTARVQTVKFVLSIPKGVAVVSQTGAAPGTPDQKVVVLNNDSTSTYRLQTTVGTRRSDRSDPVTSVLSLSNGESAIGSGSTNEPVYLQVDTSLTPA